MGGDGQLPQRPWRAFQRRWAWKGKRNWPNKMSWEGPLGVEKSKCKGLEAGSGRRSWLSVCPGAQALGIEAGQVMLPAPGLLELSAFGNGQPFKVSEQGREQSSGPYFRKTPPPSPVFQEEDSRQEPGCRDSGGSRLCCSPLSSLSPFEKSHADGGSGDLGFWSGNSPPP